MSDEQIEPIVPLPPPLPDGELTIISDPFVRDDSKRGRKRTPEQREDDRILCKKLSQEGKSTREIAAYLTSIRNYSTTYTQVAYDLLALEEILTNKKLLPLKQARAKQIELLERMQAESWEQFQLSKSDIITQRQSVRVDEKGKEYPAEKMVERKKNLADPAWMRVLMDLEKRQSQLLGLEMATKVEISGTVDHNFNLESLREKYRKKIELEIIEDRATGKEACDKIIDAVECPPASIT